MRQKLGSKVIVFNPDQSDKSVVGKQKENAPVGSEREMVGMVETGESRTPRPKEAAQNILQA